MPVGLFPMPDSEVRAGKVTSPGSHYSWELAYEVKSIASGSGSGDGYPTYAHSVTGVTTFVPNAAVISPGIFIRASSSFDGSVGTWSVTYDGPAAPFGGYTVGGSTYKTTVSIEARFQGLRLYTMEGGALPRIMWDELHIWVNGAYDTTLGPGFDLTGMGTGPNYVSVFGMPLDVSAACSAGRANRTPWSYDPCEPDNADGRDWAASITQSVSGGCRHREYPGGPWVTGPVTPYQGTVPSGSGCPFGLGSPSLSASSTYGTLMSNASSSTYAFAYMGKIARTQIDRMMCGPVVVYESDDHASIGPDPCTGEIGPVFQDHYRTSVTSSSNSGRIQLQPDFGALLNRFRPDYAKLLLRGPGFPATKATLSRSCSETSGGVTTGGTYSSNPEVHPAMATILGLVRDGDHPVLDALDYPCYAPTQAGKSQSRSVSYSYPGVVIASCPSPGAPPLVDCEDDDFVATWVCEDTTTFPDPEAASESASISFPSNVGTVANYQGHDEPIPRYLGTWGNPLWHLFDFRADWYLQGDDAPWDLYWGPIGAQWAYHPALPAEERPQTRLHNIGSGYWDHAHTPVFGAYTGGYPWTGIGRFVVREVGFPSMIGLSVASAAMLSCPDDSCTITAGSGGISLAATGTDPIVIDIDLCRLDCYPYLALLLAKSVRFPTLGNVLTLKARLLSSFASGTVRLNNDDPLLAGIDYPFVRGRDGGYAGTWGIDDGNLYVVDEGTDVALGGESAAKMSNPETLVGFQGLRGLQGAVIRLTIEPIGPGDVVLDWPVFERVQGHPEVRHLDRNRAVLMWPNGPAILWGSHLTYLPDEGLYWPWLPKALGTRNSLADALQWIYAIFEATDPGDVPAFDAEVQGWYDDFEVSLRNIGSADRQSLALLLPKGEGETIRFGIAQTIAEVPPMALWPMRARDAEWRPTGDPAQEQWDQSQEKNYIVAPVAPLVLVTPGGVPISTAAAAPAGFAVQEYTLPLSGDEASDFRLVQAGKTFGALYPWRGWWWLGTGPEEGASRGIFASQTFDGRYLRSRVGSDEPPIFGGTTVGAPTAGNWEYDDPIASAPDAIDDASHSIDAATGRVWFFAEIDGGIREAWSDDDGRTFGGWTSLGIGMRPLTGQNNGDLLTIWFVPDGDPDGPGRLVGRFRGLGDESAEEFDLLCSPSEGAAAGALRVDGKDFHGNPVGMRDAQGRWALSVYIEGDSAVLDLASFDGKGETWLKVG